MYLCEVILWTIVGCSPGNHVPTWGKVVVVMYPQEKPYWIAFSSMRDSPSRTLLWTLSELPRPEHHSGSGTISKLAFPSRSRIAGPPEWKMITDFPPEWSQKSSSLDPAPSNKLPPSSVGSGSKGKGFVNDGLQTLQARPRHCCQEIGKLNWDEYVGVLNLGL